MSWKIPRVISWKAYRARQVAGGYKVIGKGGACKELQTHTQYEGIQHFYSVWADSPSLGIPYSLVKYWLSTGYLKSRIWPFLRFLSHPNALKNVLW